MQRDTNRNTNKIIHICGGGDDNDNNNDPIIYQKGVLKLPVKTMR